MIYIPLDERFTTRDAFINLAKVTPNIVRTPPPSMLPRHKVPADLKALNSWMDDHISQKPDGVILSAEMILYGGLINSRISNDTTEVIQQRLKHVISYKEQNPQMSIYLSTVVMRIPAYNGDFEGNKDTSLKNSIHLLYSRALVLGTIWAAIVYL